MVRAQAEEAGDDLGAERRRRVQLGAACDGLDVLGDVGEPELSHQAGVEGDEGHGRGGRAGHRGLPRLRGDRAEGGAELRAGQRPLAVEAAVVEPREQPGGGDGALLAWFLPPGEAAWAEDGTARAAAEASRSVSRRTLLASAP
jgi:hypothetical protein